LDRELEEKRKSLSPELRTEHVTMNMPSLYEPNTDKVFRFFFKAEFQRFTKSWEFSYSLKKRKKYHW